MGLGPARQNMEHQGALLPADQGKCTANEGNQLKRTDAYRACDSQPEPVISLIRLLASQIST